MDLKLLEEIGLSKGEVKVYLALLKLGSSKTGELASLASVSSSKVYKILGRLEKKGLVGHVLKGKIKHFSAMEPKRIMDYVDENRLRMEQNRELLMKLLPDLEMQKKAAEQKTNATLYEGFKGVSSFFRNLVDELEKDDEYFVIGAYYGEETKDEITSMWRNFFYKHHLRRVVKGIKVNMLANFDIKGKMVATTQKKSKIRFLPQYFITNMEIVFYKNKAFIALFTNEPKGFLIESEEAVKSFRAYFDTLWIIAKN
ncbi:MAG: helix-turn-helix domain-containing protein [Candidatus Micrarchaeota archaeon]